MFHDLHKAVFAVPLLPPKTNIRRRFAFGPTPSPAVAAVVAVVDHGGCLNFLPGFHCFFQGAAAGDTYQAAGVRLRELA